MHNDTNDYRIIKHQNSCVIYFDNVVEFNEFEDILKYIKPKKSDVFDILSKIIIIDTSKFRCFIYTSYKEIYIKYYNLSMNLNKIIEIEIDKLHPQYTISKVISIDDKIIRNEYNSKNNYSININNKLNKRDAIGISIPILKQLEKYIVKDDILMHIKSIYSYLNITTLSNYYPVISNEIITLSWIYHLNHYDINTEDNVVLEIILNETREIIGTIAFDYHNYEGFSYGGNISYIIKEKYRNNNYATMALELLKKLIKDNEIVKDKTMYISTILDNYASQRVIEKNEGELHYLGDVPKDNEVYTMNHIKKVKVYKIKV
jgi:predicted acetyltransferase